MVRGVGGVCDMCMCLARGGLECVGGKLVTGLGLGFTNSGGTWGKCDMCLCLVEVVWVGLGKTGLAAWARVREGRVVLWMCVL